MELLDSLCTAGAAQEMLCRCRAEYQASLVVYGSLASLMHLHKSPSSPEDDAEILSESPTHPLCFQYYLPDIPYF